MAHYSEPWWFATGQLATNQRAIVFGPGDQNTIATIYADAGLTTVLPNPTVTDPTTGVLDFYVPDNSGTYWIFVGPVGTGDSVEWSSGASEDNPVLTVNGIAPDGAGNVDITAADVDAIPVAIMDAKGDIIAATGPDAPVRVGVGADGDVLTADSGAAAGVSWQPGGGGGGGIPESIIDAKGDLIAGSAPDTAVRVPVGTNGQYLRANSGATPGVDWDTITAADVGAVPTSRVLTAGIAMSGGGDLSADRTFDVDLGTTAGTAAAGNDSRIVNAVQQTIVDAKGDIIAATAADAVARVPVGTNGQYLRANSLAAAGVDWDTITPGDIGAVPTSRVLTAGIAMSGGGDLSADRTFDVDLGTTAGTAAAGDDTRIVNALQQTILDAKGDIIAATAADTPARFPVGTDGQALRANSATATGLEWDTLTASDVGAVPVSAAENIVYGTTTAGAPLNREISTIASADTVAWRTAESQLRADTVADANPAADADDLINRGYIQTALGLYIPASIFDAKGDIIAATAADTPARVGVGTDGQVLTADSGAGAGVSWQTPTSGGISPTIFDAKGDLLAASAADTPARLAVGTNGQALRANSATSTGLEWDTLDAADVGAIASSIVDAKGDLISATANDTPVRLAVGVNGQVLAAASAASTGLQWVYEKSAGMYPRANYLPTGGVVTARSSKAATLNAMFLIPFLLLKDATLSGIAFEVSGNVATALVRCGIYGPDSDMLPSGAAVADYGTTDASTTGTKTFSVSTALTAGLWFLAFVGQTAAPTIRHCAGWSPFVASTTFPTGTGLGWNNAWVQTGVSGTLPTIGSITDSDSPMCGVKF